MKIGVTQRVELNQEVGEVRDALDQNWTRLLELAGCVVTPIPNALNQVDAWLSSQNLDGFLLSGGNDLSHLPGARTASHARDTTEASILKWAMEYKLPVIGICRGMQMINCYLGGKLSKIEGHVKRDHEVYCVKGGFIVDVDQQVNSYHDYSIEENDLASSLIPQVYAWDGSIEAFRHAYLPWVGVMWHPERAPEPRIAAEAARMCEMFQKLQEKTE